MDAALMPPDPDTVREMAETKAQLAAALARMDTLQREVTAATTNLQRDVAAAEQGHREQEEELREQALTIAELRGQLEQLTITQSMTRMDLDGGQGVGDKIRAGNGILIDRHPDGAMAITARPYVRWRFMKRDASTINVGEARWFDDEFTGADLSDITGTGVRHYIYAEKSNADGTITPKSATGFPLDPASDNATQMLGIVDTDQLDGTGPVVIKNMLQHQFSNIGRSSIPDSHMTTVKTRTLWETGHDPVRRAYDAYDLDTFGTITIPTDLGTGVGKHLIVTLHNNAGVREFNYKILDIATGRTGPTGVGATGGTGDKGDKGLTGIRGVTGTNQGDTGITGNVGGDTGDTGPTPSTPPLKWVKTILADSWRISGNDYLGTPHWHQVSLPGGTGGTGSEEVVFDGTGPC